LQEKLDDEVLKTRLVLSNDYEELSIREVKPLDILAFVLVSLSAKRETPHVTLVSLSAKRETPGHVTVGNALRRMRLLVCARDCSALADSRRHVLVAVVPIGLRWVSTEG
jgi:hypothetical protein